jgi:hypothetical protein
MSSHFDVETYLTKRVLKPPGEDLATCQYISVQDKHMGRLDYLRTNSRTWLYPEHDGPDALVDYNAAELEGSEQWILERDRILILIEGGDQLPAGYPYRFDKVGQLQDALKNVHQTHAIGIVHPHRRRDCQRAHETALDYPHERLLAARRLWRIGSTSNIRMMDALSLMSSHLDLERNLA